MSRVGDDNGRGFCGLDHPLAARLTLHLSDSRLARRIAVGFLHFLSDFLTAHFEVAFVLQVQKHVVHTGPEEKNQATLPAELKENGANKANEPTRLVVRAAQNLIPMTGETSNTNPDHERERNKTLEYVAEPRGRENLLHLTDRAKPFDIGCKRLRCKDESALRQTGGQRYHEPGRENRNDPADC